MSSIPQSKQALLSAISTVFNKLMVDYRSILDEVTRVKSIDGNTKGSKVSVCDTVAYLIGWGNLVLKWYRLTAEDQPVDFPETGYKWNQLGQLAEHFHHQYSDWTYSQLLTELEQTTNALLLLIDSLTDEQLYHTPWYEKWTLGRMIQFNTSSPMKRIRTQIRRFKKINGAN
ncbi:ClbS/DfsB family four-helix bundle protein [Thalassotalea hakodatensis]|uniref:ClbS/DfsB family four-helix bundle protein n=1 Tax=Thalassotalea hakodatensis TaxID=3030492 RepID=UPI00257477C0|nr:ClbS/DfsB family four-helix bundle protein [Thalassotalea hakodatensis]